MWKWLASSQTPQHVTLWGFGLLALSQRQRTDGEGNAALKKTSEKSRNKEEKKQKMAQIEMSSQWTSRPKAF